MSFTPDVYVDPSYAITSRPRGRNNKMKHYKLVNLNQFCTD